VADAEDRTVTRVSSTPSMSTLSRWSPARLHWVACEAILAADALHRQHRAARFDHGRGAVVGQIDRYFIDRGPGWGGRSWPLT